MLQQIALGSMLVAITTAVHALCTAGVIGALRSMHAGRWVSGSAAKKVTLLAALVLMMFLAALAEVHIWALTYVAVGAIRELEPALYFSTVTFTTLGYGDLTLDSDWRLLAAFQAARQRHHPVRLDHRRRRRRSAPHGEPRPGGRRGGLTRPAAWSASSAVPRRAPAARAAPAPGRPLEAGPFNG
jgi:hypothetical protein